MATIEYWIQIENHAWDVSPHNIDRITGQNMQQITGKAPVVKMLTSPVTGAVRNRTMYKPLSNDALILRRYTANWAAPDDRKVNPWDLNEPNPTDNGTMGTIPGPVIECNVGDTVVVHFRNWDNRSEKDVKARTHSLHPHGFVFAPTSDGAYPLSPPDPNQAVGPEAANWAVVGVTSFKKGDRVPPRLDPNDPNDTGGTFVYTWNTFRWPTTAGVWLYHDHSICDMENVQQGAIGIIVIHNSDPAKNTPIDPDDVTIGPPDLPGGSPTGSPVRVRCFPLPFKPPVLPHDLDRLGLLEEDLPHGHEIRSMLENAPGHDEAEESATAKGKKEAKAVETKHPGHDEDSPISELIVRRGNLLLELDRKLEIINRLCLSFYRTPPEKAQYLQLFHNLGDATMCINGRKYLGNTPTLIGGVNTKMRFGVVGMGNFDGFHTFHLHGHRWIIPGPEGNTPAAIQTSPQVTPVSQFEDTRTFGPANSFVFTINGQAGSFMRAGGPNANDPLGEWHMHCHVLNHMMDGMMGSLLILQGGGLALGLPSGEPCPAGEGVTILAGSFDPPNITIMAGQKVRWTDVSGPHTVTSNTGGATGCNPVSTESFDSNPGFPANPNDFLNTGDTFEHTFNTPGTYAYHCKVHGCGMSGTVTVTPM